MPFYNVPDLSNFKLKPYVPHSCGKIPEDSIVPRIVSIDKLQLEKINDQIEAASKGQLDHVTKAENAERRSRR